MRSPARLPIALTLALGLAAVVSVGGQAPPIRGFPADALAEQHEREARFRDVPSPERLGEYMKAMTAEPHVAGRPGSRRVAEYALEKFRSFGLDARIEEHEAYMPWPVERRLEMVAPTGRVMLIQEPPVPGDAASMADEATPAFNAYSADGDVTAEIVYVNYGVPADYEVLDRLGVSVKGKIVLARYGGSWRGIKPKVAWERGAIGCLIHSDPRDDGYFQGDVYPVGPYRPEFGVQRGSVMDMPVHPGDPLTPGWGAEAGARRLSHDESQTILKVPVMPIAWGDALPILQAMQGPVAPESWRGALPLTYKVGPGPATARLRLRFDWQNRPLYNVVARIEGSTFPDEWIVLGNHHDAWNNGAADPVSGAVSLMETARGFGELLKTGWRPKRTVVFALWDGEEWGLLGSTEWAEKHGDELRAKGVVYINTDATGTGWLNAGGSHSLQHFIAEVARDVTDPKTGKPLLEEARRRTIMGLPASERAEAEKDPGWRIAPLGSGSDFTPFLQHLTLASLNLGIGGTSPGGVYHSNYDSFEWYRKFSDGDFTFGRALSQVTGTALLRLADAPVLPFRFTDTADTLARYLTELRTLQAEKNDAPAVDLTPLDTAIRGLARAAHAYEKSHAGVATASTATLMSRADAMRLVNQLAYTSERRLGDEAGLPRREWFRHQVYAPGYYTGYGVKTLPHIREGLEESQWDEAREGVTRASAVINALAEQVTRATAALARLTAR